MTILIFEDNLMWSSRLRQTLTALGHTGVVLSKVPAELPAAEVAIVNLSGRFDVSALVPRLKAAGLYVIGHAGHKEKDLQKLGMELGCDKMSSNSELTFKIEGLLASVG